jgi:hypothetical protein
MGIVKEHIKEIDGITYTTRVLPATQALTLSPRVISLFGGKTLALVLSIEDPSKLMDDPTVVASLVTTICGNITDDELQQRSAGVKVVSPLLTIKDLLAKTKADKVRIGDSEVEGEVAKHFDSHFEGRLGHLLKVAMWVAQVNFGGLSSENP